MFFLLMGYLNHHPEWMFLSSGTARWRGGVNVRRYQSAHTLTEAADGKKGNALHEYEFKNKEDLRRFFTPHFKFVKVWETIYPTRHNLYFAASQSEISPFG
jgi:hypothetical protein